jgi:uncharacterized alkaline shock family protein YloU
MSGRALVVDKGVIDETVRAAALEVPGVLRLGRSGPAWRTWIGGSPVRTRVEDGRVTVRIWLVARPGQALPTLAARVRGAVSSAVERLLGLDLESVTVVIDGVGG